MAITVLQAYSAGGGSTGTVSSTSASLTANCTNPSLFLAFVDWGDATTAPPTLSDTVNTWTSARGSQGNTGSAYVYWAANTSTTSMTITATFGNAVAGPDIAVIEVGGFINPVPAQVNSATGASGNAASGNVITTAAAAFLFGGAAGFNVGTTPTTPAYIEQGTVNGNAAILFTTSSTGTYGATWTGTSGVWQAVLVAFAESSGTFPSASVNPRIIHP